MEHQSGKRVFSAVYRKESNTKQVHATNKNIYRQQARAPEVDAKKTSLKNSVVHFGREVLFTLWFILDEKYCFQSSVM